MAEQAKTYKEPTWIANLASAKFEIYHTPKWLDLMAAEAVDDAEK